MPPLGGAFKDGKLYGRGVCNMKGGLASALPAAKLAGRDRDAWPGEIVLTLAGDEENMGSLGTGYMLDHIPHAKGDANICGDVGRQGRALRQKGLMWVEIEATVAGAWRACPSRHQRHRPTAVALDRLKGLEDLPVTAPPRSRRDQTPRRSRRHCRARARRNACSASQ